MKVKGQDVWVDQEVGLWFLQDGEDPRSVWCANLSDIHIGKGLGSSWECFYCGATLPASDLKCTTCNAPRRTRRRKATALLTGVLPKLMWFDLVKDGFTLEARRCRHNSPDWYDGSEPVARLTNCQIVDKRIPTLVVGLVDGGTPPTLLELVIQLEGDFSFADAEHESTGDE